MLRRGVPPRLFHARNFACVWPFADTLSAKGDLANILL